MERDETPYKLVLSEEDFRTLESIIRASYFNAGLRGDPSVDKLHHLEGLLREAERKAYNPYLTEAKDLVERFYIALHDSRIRSINTSDVSSLLTGTSKIRMAVREDVLRDEEASKYISENIPSGIIEWRIIPCSPYRFEERLINPTPTPVSINFNGVPNFDKIIDKIIFDDEEAKKRGFFKE